MPPEMRTGKQIMEQDSADLKPIPLSVPDLRGNERAYLARCVTDNWVSSAGPFVTEFETRIATLTARRHAVSTVNGTAALQLALRAAGVGDGDLVVVPDWTFAATANAVLRAGGIPFFVDVATDSLTLDSGLVATVLANPSYQGRVAAVIPVHAAGHPPDMDVLIEICGRSEIPLVEDAAGAIGATYKERPAGGFGDASIFSFNGNKIVTAGGGGMVMTDRADWAERAKHLSTQARLGDEYEHDAVGDNLRMTNLNAAVGLAQLERLDEMLAARSRIARRYDAAIAECEMLASLPRAPWAVGNDWMYTLQTETVADAKTLLAHFAERKIGARSFWRSLSAQPPYAEMPSLLNGVSAAVSGRTVSLPCSSNLTEDEQGRVIEAIADWASRGPTKR